MRPNRPSKDPEPELGRSKKSKLNLWRCAFVRLDCPLVVLMCFLARSVIGWGEFSRDVRTVTTVKMEGNGVNGATAAALLQSANNKHRAGIIPAKTKTEFTRSQRKDSEVRGNFTVEIRAELDLGMRLMLQGLIVLSYHRM